MIALKPQYLEDTAGKKLVVITLKEFDSLMEDLEELEDIKRYDAAKKRKQVFTDAQFVFDQIESKRK